MAHGLFVPVLVPLERPLRNVYKTKYLIYTEIHTSIWSSTFHLGYIKIRSMMHITHTLLLSQNVCRVTGLTEIEFTLF